MIQRERVADNVYSFQSDIYAQVNAGAVIGPNWAVVIDTLALPEETLAIRDFIEQDLNVPVRYVINTHSHADHAWGNCFFPGSIVVGHSLCRQLLNSDGPVGTDYFEWPDDEQPAPGEYGWYVIARDDWAGGPEPSDRSEVTSVTIDADAPVVTFDTAGSAGFTNQPTITVLVEDYGSGLPEVGLGSGVSASEARPFDLPCSQVSSTHSAEYRIRSV